MQTTCTKIGKWQKIFVEMNHVEVVDDMAMHNSFAQQYVKNTNLSPTVGQIAKEPL